MHLSDYDYHLPRDYIAQEPATPRDHSRLMVLTRSDQTIGHGYFYDIVDLVDEGDVLVLNDTRVIPARIPAFKAETGGGVEVLLLRQLDAVTWRCIVGGRRVTEDIELTFESADYRAQVIDVGDGAERTLRFNKPVDVLLEASGNLPLPPYIDHPVDDTSRYQTVYSRENGSAAAPTAGLHFTDDLLLRLRDKKVQFATCTLHIGLDTFQPVKAENIDQHHIHSEYAQLDEANARIINQAKLAGRRIIAVGTTSVRTIETAGILSEGGDPARPSTTGEACAWRPVQAFHADTRLFIYPGYRWRVVDAMITNFHLPKSSLLMLVSAFAGNDFIRQAYDTAITDKYRFFSFGDAMFIR